MFQHTTLPLKMTLSAALLSVALVGCGNNATDTATPATAPDTAAPAMTNSAPADTMATNAVAPDTMASTADFTAASATWTKIQAAKAELDKIIAAKELSKVHEAAFKVRDIVKTLPAESSGLPADKMATLNTQVKNVEQLAGKLDESGDSKNLKATQDNQAGLNDTLDTIKELYPTGTFQ